VYTGEEKLPKLGKRNLRLKRVAVVRQPKLFLLLLNVQVKLSDVHFRHIPLFIWFWTPTKRAYLGIFCPFWINILAWYSNAHWKLRRSEQLIGTVEPFQFEASAESKSVNTIPFRHLYYGLRGAELECGPHSHFQQRPQIGMVRQ